MYAELISKFSHNKYLRILVYTGKVIIFEDNKKSLREQLIYYLIQLGNCYLRVYSEIICCHENCASIFLNFKIYVPIHIE